MLTHLNNQQGGIEHGEAKFTIRRSPAYSTSRRRDPGGGGEEDERYGGSCGVFQAS
jgi:hypothetical protein